MKHIAFWNPKGGVGKTTLALNVAGALANMGYKVGVADLDPKKSACFINLVSDGKIGFPIFNGLPQTLPELDILLTDSRPQPEEVYLPCSGLVVMPLQPVAHEIAAFYSDFGTLMQAGNHRKEDVVPVVNMFIGNRIQHKENLAEDPILRDADKVVRRAIYQRLMDYGVTIYDTAFDNLSGIKVARKEINTLTHSLLSRLEIENAPREKNFNSIVRTADDPSFKIKTFCFEAMPKLGNYLIHVDAGVVRATARPLNLYLPESIYNRLMAVKNGDTSPAIAALVEWALDELEAKGDVTLKITNE